MIDEFFTKKICFIQRRQQSNLTAILGDFSVFNKNPRFRDFFLKISCMQIYVVMAEYANRIGNLIRGKFSIFQSFQRRGYSFHKNNSFYSFKFFIYFFFVREQHFSKSLNLKGINFIGNVHIFIFIELRLPFLFS